MTGGRVVVLGNTGRNFAAGMSGGVAYVWNKNGDFDYYCNMEMVELSLIEDSTSRKELHELIRKHYHHTGSHLAGLMLDNWNKYVDEFIQIVPIEYKKVLQRGTDAQTPTQDCGDAERLLNIYTKTRELWETQEHF